MSDMPTGQNPEEEKPEEEIPEEEISEEQVPPLLLRMVPESADSIAEKFHEPAETAVLTEDAAVFLYELLAECFTTPVLLPQLRSDTPDTELLTRCWDFVERIVDHSTEHVGGAVYFEVLDQLFLDSGLVEAAWPYMKERTQARTLQMLDDADVRLRGINW
ncbi:hypothetical protein [Streptomyces sp. Z38]|uniref:hypothetical protein n=1 Tax=Streptomyces sp. Z38 TaxID=2682780 RepID=UPI0012EAB8B3|nr:hypothetical protein [Streptomyces sp. Z38]MUT89042.1 hypothetical protein [Streptomyces sp. Z38]